MAQLTIYIDDKTLARVTRSARQEKDSVSNWVRKRITASMEGAWPAGYFDGLGALNDIDLARPQQPDTRHDRSREAL